MEAEAKFKSLMRSIFGGINEQIENDVQDWGYLEVNRMVERCVQPIEEFGGSAVEHPKFECGFLAVEHPERRFTLERETGIEPATNGLGSRYSTIELLPLRE